jgi:MoaA/NifB/PqqE/SkfB family radical SAM enzyme
MQCKFLKHGLAISYDHVVKPCCEWRQDVNYPTQNHISQVDLTTWHQQNIPFEQQLANDIWPAACSRCEHREGQQRKDSIRLGGEQAYAHYANDDITLEIRPGNICNFSCQTCWPEASSRVSQHYAQAGLVDIKSINSTRIDNFDFLVPIADRIQDVVLLGGEPFYDPNCKQFLAWAHANLHSNITMFTNGSTVDWEWIEDYAGTITMVFSIDAVGKAAEYVRFGTDWPVVLKNFEQARANPKISLRVNITTSIYNYHELDQVIDLLAQNWPSVVTFGSPTAAHFLEGVVPMHQRDVLVQKLYRVCVQLLKTDIPPGQKSNAINALKSIIANLKTHTWDQKNHQVLKEFVSQMDRVKHIAVRDHCEFLADVLDFCE